MCKVIQQLATLIGPFSVKMVALRVQVLKLDAIRCNSVYIWFSYGCYGPYFYSVGSGSLLA